MSLHKFLITATAALLLAACSSGVKLDNVPVEDRAGVSATGGADANAAKSGVAPVDVSGTNLPAGPTGVAKVIYFDYDSYAVKPDFAPVIEAHARYLKADAKRKVALEGHTDDRGGREYNLALGQKRAEAVRRALSLQGVSEAQLEAVSFGKEKLAAQGADEEAHSKNRRVEVSYR
jgi:peptidoglycan-associated lipoprotein